VVFFGWFAVLIDCGVVVDVLVVPLPDEELVAGAGGVTGWSLLAGAGVEPDNSVSCWAPADIGCFEELGWALSGLCDCARTNPKQKTIVINKGRPTKAVCPERTCLDGSIE
jgi:hypothetical protein